MRYCFDYRKVSGLYICVKTIGPIECEIEYCSC